MPAYPEAGQKGAPTSWSKNVYSVSIYYVAWQPGRRLGALRTPGAVFSANKDGFSQPKCLKKYCKNKSFFFCDIKVSEKLVNYYTPTL